MSENPYEPPRSLHHELVREVRPRSKGYGVAGLVVLAFVIIWVLLDAATVEYLKWYSRSNVRPALTVEMSEPGDLARP